MGENIQVDGDDEKDEKIAKENEVVLKYGLVLSYFSKYLEPIDKYEGFFKLLCHNPQEKKPHWTATLESLN